MQDLLSAALCVLQSPTIKDRELHRDAAEFLKQQFRGSTAMTNAKPKLAKPPAPPQPEDEPNEIISLPRRAVNKFHGAFNK